MAAPRRAALLVALLAVLVALLAPTGYAFARMWQSTADDAAVATLERVGVAYLRPMINLLATLVDAQSAAARGDAVDAGAVRAAIAEVNRVNQSHGDELRATQRWESLSDQIQSAVNGSVNGPDVLNTYAVPIGLAQMLLAHVGGTSGMVRDPDPAAFTLIDGAVVLLPDVMVNASAIVALARSATDQALAIAVAEDRITRASTDVGNRLQLAVDKGATGAGAAQLKLVDDFMSATLAMIKAPIRPTETATTRLAEIDAAEAGLQEAAVTLASGLLSEFDSLLERRASDLGQQHQRIVAAGSVATVAALPLLWISLATHRSIAGRGDDAAGELERGGDPVGPEGPLPDALVRSG